MIKMGAENWRAHGNVLGTNEIMAIMFHRDVMVLGLSDGVMCAATGFGLILQKAIHRGLLSWNKTGWIIQSVSSLEDRRDRTDFEPSYGKFSTLLLYLSGRCSGNGHGVTQSFLSCMQLLCS